MGGKNKIKPSSKQTWVDSRQMVRIPWEKNPSKGLNTLGRVAGGSFISVGRHSLPWVAPFPRQGTVNCVAVD